MSTYESAYKEHVNLTQNIADTRRKMLLGFTDFHTLMGDPVPSNINMQLIVSSF